MAGGVDPISEEENPRSSSISNGVCEIRPASLS
jgi:hypothetical protein